MTSVATSEMKLGENCPALGPPEVEEVAPATSEAPQQPPASSEPEAPAESESSEEAIQGLLFGEDESGIRDIDGSAFTDNPVAIVDADGLNAMGELARALSYMWVQLAPPGPQHRGRLGLYVEEAIEKQLEERGALSPGIQASTGLDASLSDQLYRARLVEMRGIAIGIPSLEGITNLGRSLDAEDSAVLRWWIAAAADRPVHLVISNENTRLRVYPSPVLFQTLFDVAPEPVTPMPPSPSMADSSESMEMSDLPPAVEQTNVLGTEVATIEELHAGDAIAEDEVPEENYDRYTGDSLMDVDLPDLDRALGLTFDDSSQPAPPVAEARRGRSESSQLPLDYESPVPVAVNTQDEGDRPSMLTRIASPAPPAQTAIQSEADEAEGTDLAHFVASDSEAPAEVSETSAEDEGGWDSDEYDSETYDATSEDESEEEYEVDSEGEEYEASAEEEHEASADEESEDEYGCDGHEEDFDSEYEASEEDGEEFEASDLHSADESEVAPEEEPSHASEASLASAEEDLDLGEDIDEDEFLRTLQEDSSRAPEVEEAHEPGVHDELGVQAAADSNLKSAQQPKPIISSALTVEAPEPLPTKKIARNPFIRMADPNEAVDSQENDAAFEKAPPVQTQIEAPEKEVHEATLSGAAAPDPNDPFNQLAAREWKTWVTNLEAARGPKPLSVIERMFVTDYTRLREAVRRGVAEPSANSILTEWQESFSKSYSEAFDALRVRGKRPTMVLDIPEMATRLGRLQGAKKVQLLMVDGLRFDLGLMVQDRMRSQAGASLTERLLLWSALPSVTSYQLELLGKGPDGLKTPMETEETPALVARGPSARVPRRVRTGSLELYKLDVVEDCLREVGTPIVERMDAIADETAAAVCEHLNKQAPRTMVVVFGDHGFALDPSKAGTSEEASQGGSSPEEVLVPAFAWLTGAVH